MVLSALAQMGNQSLLKPFLLFFYLRCANHLCQNVKDKLSSLNIDANVCLEMFADIFDRQKGTHFESGLVDCTSKKIFWKSLGTLKERWNNLE